MLLLSIAFFLNLTGWTQQDFVYTQNAIYETSCNQWICKELRSANPAHFNCQDATHTWQFPEQDSLRFGGQMIYVSMTDREIFRELLFPDGSCQRYLTLISLCDLYFPLFRKKTEETGISSDFKYLPILLSGCNQSFQSNDRSGLWAMDYLVARKMHLRVDTLIDERNGGDFTTNAACAYIRELTTKFDNDVVKTIAAYRMGLPYIHKLEAKEKDNFLEQIPLSEKQAIQFLAYVKSLIETTRTQNQLQYYFDVFAMYEGVVVEKNSRLDAMHLILGLDIVHAREVNPVFKGSMVPSMYRKVPFLMPIEQAALWKLKRDSIADWHPPVFVLLPDTAITTVYHTVKKGESLGTIAKKHHTTVRKIKHLNKLKSDKLKPGQRLIVAQRSEDRSIVAKEQVDQSKTEPKVSEKTGDTKSQAGETITYKVKSGDSLWKIANKYKGVTAEDIKRWNKCGDDLRPGQKLIIHLPR